MRGLWWFVLGAAACGPALPEDSVWGTVPSGRLDLRASLSAEEVPLMGEVALYLDLYRQDELEVEFSPSIPEGFRGEIDPPLEQPLGDGIWERYALHLRPVLTGSLTIPPFEAHTSATGELREVVTTSELDLEVTSLLVEAGDEVEAPAPPFPSPLPWQRWSLLALAALIVAAVCIVFWRRRSGTLAVGGEVPLPAHTKALRELARLRQAPRETHEEVEAFYVAVSQVMRIYLEERFGLHAPERTTEEFLAEVEAGESLLTSHRYALGQFLEQCDLVKFAGLFPAAKVHEETFRIAEEFVESTRPDRIREGAA